LEKKLIQSSILCPSILLKGHYTNFLLYDIGEAVYVDDIPAPKNCLHGEFIYSTQPLAFVKNITFKSSLSSQKIITVVSAKDIPKEGQNIGSMSVFGDEPLFGDPVTEFAGQALGVVVVIYFIFLLLS